MRLRETLKKGCPSKSCGGFFKACKWILITFKLPQVLRRKRRNKERGVKAFFSSSLLPSEFLDNDWAVTIQRHLLPSETTSSASFSLFISLHFSSLASPPLMTSKKKSYTESAFNLHGRPLCLFLSLFLFSSFLYSTLSMVFCAFSKYLGQVKDLWLRFLHSEQRIFSEKMRLPTTDLRCGLKHWSPQTHFKCADREAREVYREGETIVGLLAVPSSSWVMNI